MADESDTPSGTGGDNPTPDELDLETFDLDGDGTVSLIESERARLGLIDARLEQIAAEGGLTGSLAEAAHNVLDRLDNDDE